MLTTWGQEQRQAHHRGIERLLAKQLLEPIQKLTDIAPAFLEKNYVLEVIGPKKFTLTHEKNGMCFSNAELRPNGRDFLEQLQEVVGQIQARNAPAPTRSRSDEMER